MSETDMQNITIRSARLSERAIRLFLCSSAALSVLITLAIIGSVMFESVRFFEIVPPLDFFFGTHWSPQSSGFGGEGSDSAHLFGAIPVFWGTFLITVIAMLTATPIALFAAIFLCEYATRRQRSLMKPVLELLAGIPSVVYGFFALLAVAPLLRDAGEMWQISISSESAMVAGVVMGIMIIPYVLSLSEDVLNAVPRALVDASLGLGATHSETIRLVMIPAALPGIISAILLGISRAVGETMIVVMAAGLSAQLSVNPLESVTTVTVQIVTMLVGDHEFNSAKTLSAFALGLTLFCFTLLLNALALYTSRRFREKYD